MLSITIPAQELWDQCNNCFTNFKGINLKLEHSLLALSKWEAKWCKPFLSSEKTHDEIIYYIKCMTITQNVPEVAWLCLTNENIQAITDYIDSPMTATVIKDVGGKKNNQLITSELIYYWMIANNIPFECEKWHITRLITLICVCNAENGQKKKMSLNDTMRQNSELNRARKAAMKIK